MNLKLDSFPIQHLTSSVASIYNFSKERKHNKWTNNVDNTYLPKYTNTCI